MQCEAGAFATIALAMERIDRFVQEQFAATDSDPGLLMGIGIAMPWFPRQWHDELGISKDQAEEWRRGTLPTGCMPG